jgi:hypothetical protein
VSQDLSATRNIIADNSIVVDADNSNTGTLDSSAFLFGWSSNEGISSKRTSGGNQYGIDLYTNRISRLSITNAGRVGIGTQTPGQVLDVMGNVNVSGSVYKTGGFFKIDHPLDPKNKYLYHSFVESPDMMNIYNGNVVTDTQGYATVKLPEWFEALNRDFRYQLTVIGSGDTWARARISKEIEKNSFVIQTDVPRTKVSWLVTGIRKDAYAEAHPIKVEEDKSLNEKGSCLHPEACE